MPNDMITIEITNGETVYKWYKLRNAHFLQNTNKRCDFTMCRKFGFYDDWFQVKGFISFSYCWIKFRVLLGMFREEQHLPHQHMRFPRDTVPRSTPTCLPAPRNTASWRWQCLPHDPGRSPSENPQRDRVMMTRRPSTLRTLTSYQKTHKEIQKMTLKTSRKDLSLMFNILALNDNSPKACTTDRKDSMGNFACNPTGFEFTCKITSYFNAFDVWKLCTKNLRYLFKEMFVVSLSNLIPSKFVL